MKTLYRILSAILTLLMLMGACLLILPVSAENPEGVSFTAIDQYIPDKKFSNTPNTYEAWVKLPSSLNDRGGVILGNYYDNAKKAVISFEVYSGGNPRLYWLESSGKTANWIFTDVDLRKNEWLHVAIARDVNAGKVHCYINGELEQSLNITSDVGREDIISEHGFRIGGDLRSNNTQYFKGAIREIAVFSDVRTEGEIQMDMISPIGQEDLIAYYNLKQNTGHADVVDLSQNGYDIRYNTNIWINPEDKEKPTNYAYSFAVVGDTQIVNHKYPNSFPLIYDWILDNIEEKNIKFVFGLGDITDKDADAEWARAKAAITSLDGKVPYSIARGNHDSASKLNATFPWSDYQNVMGGSFGRSVINSYQTLTIGEVKYLMITLDFGPSDDVLEWAGNLCEQYSDHNVIISTHCYLYRDGTTLDQRDVCPPLSRGGENNGDHIWHKFVSKHKNIVLVLSGHDPCDQIVVAQDKGWNGNTVTQMLIDPQGADAEIDGGLGMVAMLYFSEDGRDVTVEYYSTIQEKFFMQSNQFTMTLDVVEEGEFGNQDSNTTQEPTDDQPATDTTDEQDVGASEQKKGCASTMSMKPVIFISLAACGILLTVHKKEIYKKE